MCAIMDQYGQHVKGMFSFFDRMIIDGYIQPLAFEYRRANALLRLGVLYKDYAAYFKSVTDEIRKRVEGLARESGRPMQYLDSPKESKEAIAKKYLEEQPVSNGLICVLSTLEMCKGARIRGSDSGKLTVKTCSQKCLHYYLYYLDEEYGFMFIRIQTWFPFNVRVYINGRELMKSAFQENGITYQCYDNSFTDISDVDKAQELADQFDSAKLRRHLDGMALNINPFLDTILKVFGQGYYWCVSQCEYATDIMFKERSLLEDIYPSLVDSAFHDLNCTDVFTFMGRKLSPQFQGEAVSDYKKRPIGCRVKFRCKANSIKMYDKYSVLRTETTINNPHDFKIYGPIRHKDGTEAKGWKPMGKSVSNLYRYAEISKSCNQRLLDAMTDIVPTKSVLDEIGEICDGTTVNGKRVAGFHVWSPSVVCIMETVCDGKYIMNGFRNRDLREVVFAEQENEKKRSARTSRLIRKLRNHGLIKKVPRSRRYLVTHKGRRIMGALIGFYHKDFPKLAAKAT